MHTKRAQGLQGFTLIEILVVIAIIGILSSVVLASLNDARKKGANAAVKSNLANIRAQAELYYDIQPNSYGSTLAAAPCPTSGTTMFFADQNIRNAISGATDANGDSTLLKNRCAVGANGASYAISVKLKEAENGKGFWCIDSEGTSKGITTGNWSGGGVTNVAKCPAN